MNKEELSESIREGINKSMDDFAKEILHVCLIILVIVLISIFVISPLWNNYQYSKPPERFQQTAVAAQYTPCMYQELDCKIYNLTAKMQIDKCLEMMNRDTKCYNVLILLIEKRICGYTEANFWYEDFKSNYGGNKSELGFQCD